MAIQTHKDPISEKTITKQAVDSAFGKVLNNAKDWDGQRQKRGILPQLNIRVPQGPTSEASGDEE